MDKEHLKSSVSGVPGLGATGTFPAGKLNEHDEGGLRLAIGIKDGVVMIDFGTEVTWLGLPKAEAVAFAETILRRAKELP